MELEDALMDLLFLRQPEKPEPSDGGGGEVVDEEKPLPWTAYLPFVIVGGCGKNACLRLKQAQDHKCLLNIRLLILYSTQRKFAIRACSAALTGHCQVVSRHDELICQ
ncbi:hypothetical protein PoB_002819600 [Plakobranchus ocellatus]|uniref:Uncharacterized protein n=1 Tax=Plakobranchus ocellatus TaxID=259542 RepID=A0AAV3ZRK2_9GAST|nr:hypothetical protein PoB_002819600 [Plakobranchus ocellatus]